MAIMGFLVHTLPEESRTVEATLGRMKEITTYGIHQEVYVVAVAEAPHEEMEKLLEQVKTLQGVLTTYVTSLSIEDELFADTDACSGENSSDAVRREDSA
ncbi:chaperone NapD [Desulfosarcina sp. OttesenSCG-928-A07]|nr:chaperone NapD [Desulfosarcina sp. OttesenSCG-928-G17]MDL2328459.1 chaperone NapD [Desulfosarcina sp. OttesenSCG-928-A07]